MYTLCQYGPANLNRRITAPLPPCQCWKSHQLSRFWRQSNLTWRLMGWDFFGGTFADRGSSTCLLTFLCSISFVITNILNHKTHPPPSFQCCQCWKSNQISMVWRQSDLTWRLIQSQIALWVAAKPWKCVFFCDDATIPRLTSVPRRTRRTRRGFSSKIVAFQKRSEPQNRVCSSKIVAFQKRSGPQVCGSLLFEKATISSISK